MSDTANEGTSTEADKPAAESNEVKFPPFPGTLFYFELVSTQYTFALYYNNRFTEPTDKDFEDDVSEEDRSYFKKKFPGNYQYMCF